MSKMFDWCISNHQGSCQTLQNRTNLEILHMEMHSLDSYKSEFLDQKLWHFRRRNSIWPSQSHFHHCLRLEDRCGKPVEENHIVLNHMI